VPPADPFGLLGQVLDGHFRVERCVGEGGFSIVYKGTHIGLSEPIAIKCLKLPGALGSAIVDSFVKRFRDESRLQYKLSQGNLHVVRSIASGTTIAPATSALVPYTVLEWLEGRSLAAEFVDRRERGLRGRPLEEVVRLLDSAIDAVAYAHAQGVVHRDLNPGNLFLARTSSGVRLKVLDFGVAKVMADSVLAMPSARTVGNMRMFAPAYGAPEQFDDRAGAVGPWTDVYAIALVTLEALRDRTVVEGDHVGEFAMKALDRADRPTPRRLGTAVGDEVENAFARAVAVDPRNRPRDAGEFWGMLKHAMQVDAGSGRLAHHIDVGPSPRVQSHGLLGSPASIGSTLRIDERAPSAKAPAIEILHPPSAPPLPDLLPLGGTLRVTPSNPRDAALATAEALAATMAAPPPEPREPEPSVSVPVVPRSRASLWAFLAGLVVVVAVGAGGILWWHSTHMPRAVPSGTP
jgi:serine/threonine-protein kinase